MLLLARLAQLVERKTLNLVVVGSSPTVGTCFAHTKKFLFARAIEKRPSRYVHQWFSGRIHRCHRCDPGSIPG